MRLDPKNPEHQIIADRILHHPEIYPMITDDYADPNHTRLGSFMLMQPHVWMVHPSKHILLMATTMTNSLYEVHTMIEPQGRGKQAVRDVRAAAKWFFENNKTAAKVITYVPFFNPAARSFARIVGMVEEGICTKSFLKDGQLHDMWIYGLEKEAICQQ